MCDLLRAGLPHGSSSLNDDLRAGGLEGLFDVVMGLVGVTGTLFWRTGVSAGANGGVVERAGVFIKPGKLGTGSSSICEPTFRCQ